MDEAPAPHVFIGGTGRSGTTVLCRLLGHHSQYAHFPFELKFHSQPGGLTDLLLGRATVERFESRLRQRWWHRVRSDGRERGLSQIVTAEEVEAALEALRADHDRDPRGAAGALLRTVLSAWAAQEGKPACVEATPSTVFRTDLLGAMVPDSKFIHIHRDGRDVAASVVRKPWGPDSHTEALRWWAKRLRRADEGMARLPDDRGLTIHFERLVRDDRDGAYQELLAFLEVDDEPVMRAYFEYDMGADAANIGRWRHDVPDAERGAFDALYAELIDRRAARQRASGVAV